MSEVNKKLAISLSSESVEIIPYLPYLLQDLWELGSSPLEICDLIVNNIAINCDTRVLDLACGKGAVSVKLAKKFKLQVKGIDILEDFIFYAEKKASEWGVDKYCKFIVQDINKSVLTEKGYDIVILGAVGDVLGDKLETLKKLKKTIKKGGYIIIDDAYGKDNNKSTYPTKKDYIEIIKKADLTLIADKIITYEELVNINSEQQPKIASRAYELIEKYPDKADLFNSYIASQLKECEELERDIDGVTMLLQDINAIE